MASILKVFTPEQLVLIMRNYVLSKNVGMTDWNEGSTNLTLVEAVAEIVSETQFDMLNGLRKAIPVSFFDAFNFQKRLAQNASGYVRAYRRPFFTVNYTGADAQCLMSITATDFLTVTGGTPGDNLSLDFTTYTDITSLVAAIDAHPNYSAVEVQGGAVATTTLFQYTNLELVGSTNYRGNAGRDIMLSSSGAEIIGTGIRFTLDGLDFITQASSTIAAGDATTPDIGAECLVGGLAGNIVVNAFDTENGKGSVSNLPPGAEYMMNDSAFVNGLDEETDEERLSRFQAFVSGLAGGTVRGIEAGALTVSGIRGVSVRNNFPSAGQVTVIADDGTGQLSAAKQTEVQEVLEGDPADFVNFPGYVAAGVTLFVAAPNVVEVNVNITAYRIGSLSDEAQIIATIKTAVETYINTRKLGEDVVRSEIIKRAKSAHSAVFDIEVPLPAANVSIAEDEVSRTGAGTAASVTVSVVTYSSIP